MGDFIVQDGDNHGLDIQNVINDILHGDVSLENDQELNMDGDDDDDDEDYNGDEDEIGEDSEFDDDVRFFLPDSEDTSDSFSDFSSD